MVTYAPLPLLKDGCVYNSSEVVANKLFVFGGCDIKGKALKVSQFVDLSSREDFIKVSDMPRIKAGSSILHIDDKIMTIGGIYDKQCQLNKVDMYDIGSDKWTELASLPNPVQGPTTIARDNAIYCAGGLSSGMTTMSNFGMMDMCQERWQGLPDMPSAQFNAGGFLYNDCLYIIGGRNGKLFCSSCNCYDFRANAWRILPPVPNEYRNIFNGCVHLNDDVFLIGGLNEVPIQGFSNSVYRLDLKTEKWTTMPNILKARADFGAFGIDDQLVIAGGMGQLQGLAASVEILNVPSKKWSLNDDLPTIHASSTKCVSERSMFMVSGMSNIGPSKNVTEIRL